MTSAPSAAINAYVPHIYLAARDYDRAVHEALRAVELEPQSPVARWQLGRASLFAGDSIRSWMNTSRRVLPRDD